MVTKAWKVYGADGHRQRQSFNPSCKYDWSNDNYTRIVQVLNSDLTHTNEYNIIIITRDAALECYKELLGQLSDGLFEDCRVGNVEEIDNKFTLSVKRCFDVMVLNEGDIEVIKHSLDTLKASGGMLATDPTDGHVYPFYMKDDTKLIVRECSE